MRSFLITLLLISGLSSFAQTPLEKELLTLSNRIFTWEVNGHIDSLEQRFDQQFVVVNASGESQTKKQYLGRLRSGSFVHNAITVNKNTSIVSGNTATVFGDGLFNVTVIRNTVALKLSYIEVFTGAGQHKPWKVLAMHASNLPEQH